MKINAPEALMAAEVTRRGLMKTTAIGGLAVASSAFTLPFTRLASAADALSPPQPGKSGVECLYR
jgi:anaerobic dimethyl sulfoxide reductase subunit A